MEKAYKAMVRTGAANIVLGIIVAVTGITVGVLSIVSGARLLRHRKKMIF